jgi:hypothetical protein
VYLHGRHRDYTLIPKSASVFGLPGVGDYEPQTSRRFAEITYKLAYGASRTLSDLNQFNGSMFRIARARPLLDLMAARWWIVDRENDAPGSILRRRGVGPPVWEEGRLAVYENPRALPRASYVPVARIVADPPAALSRLASGAHDPRRFAAIEAAPADGFLGENPRAAGAARIVLDRSERVVIETWAEAAGFLFLSDQLYPGWSATVNGAPAEILRANHAFRLVRVPAGPATVVFRYRPVAFYAGLAVSAATAAGLALAGIAGRRWRSSPGRRASLEDENAPIDAGKVKEDQVAKAGGGGED